MSDLDNTDDELTSKSKRKSDREKSQVEPIVSDEDLFNRLELLFYDEPEVEHFPEKIDVHVMQGKNLNTFGMCLKVITFAPKKAPSKKAQEDNGVVFMGSGKPSKERLVALTNQLVHMMKRDCDERGYKQTYGIHAWHSLLGEGPYEQILRTYKPSGRYKKNGEDDEPDLSDERQFVKTIHEEHRGFMNLIGSMYEGAEDRSNRMIQQLMARNAYLEQRLEQTAERLERSLSLEWERRERQQWMAIKNKAADRGMNFLESYGPMLMSKITGSPLVPMGVNGHGIPPEAATLQNFLKTESEGGQLTQEQAHAAFGIFDEEKKKIVKPGILTEEQGTILIKVAYGQLPVDELDKLIPGGEFGITPEQIQDITRHFDISQLGPLMLIIQSRTQAKKKKES